MVGACTKRQKRQANSKVAMATKATVSLDCQMVRHQQRKVWQGFQDKKGGGKTCDRNSGESESGKGGQAKDVEPSRIHA